MSDVPAVNAHPLAGARIAVIGAGWYGCHTALTLRGLGATPVVFDAATAVMSRASGHNQNRLHQGFHYPRSHITREQSRRGFRRFCEVYPDLSEVIEHNYFAIAERDSLLDIETYETVMRSSGLQFRTVDARTIGLERVSGVLACEERLIDTAAAARYFARELANELRLGQRVQSIDRVDTSSGLASGVQVAGEDFDAAVVCTWGTWQPPAAWDIYYEPCATLLYEAAAPRVAITIMDGAFYSLFPLREGAYTLTSVGDTPLARVDTVQQAQAVIAGFDASQQAAMRDRVEAAFSQFYPAFGTHFRFTGIDYSVKTKLRDATDARPALVERSGRRVDVLSGKIDAVFEATDEVIDELTEAITGETR